MRGHIAHCMFAQKAEIYLSQSSVFILEHVSKYLSEMGEQQEYLTCTHILQVSCQPHGLYDISFPHEDPRLRTLIFIMPETSSD